MYVKLSYIIIIIILLLGCIASSYSGLLLHMTVTQSNVVDLSISLCVCCHICERCINGWADQDAIWVADSGEPKEPCLRVQSPTGRGTFKGCPPHRKLCSSQLHTNGWMLTFKQYSNVKLLMASAIYRCSSLGDRHLLFWEISDLKVMNFSSLSLQWHHCCNGLVDV